MHQHKHLHRILSATALTMLFGTTSVLAQSGAASDATTPGATSGAAASSAGTSASATKSTLSKADQNLMHEIARSNLAEIETGKIALTQSKNDQVREFAQKMIDDHTQAQQELEQLAQAKGVTLPTEPDSKHQAQAKKMRALEGAKFDKQYIAQGGLSDHQKTHRMLERGQTRAEDPELKALVEKMTPIVGQHLTMAQDMKSGKASVSGSSMGPAGTSSSSSGESDTSEDSNAAGGTSGSSNSSAPGK